MLRKIQQKAPQFEPVDEIKSFNQFIKEVFRLCIVAYKVLRLAYGTWRLALQLEPVDEVIRGLNVIKVM